MYNIFFQPVKSIIPIKTTAEKALERLKINNIRDLVFYKPYAFNKRNDSPNLRSLKEGESIQADVTIDAVHIPQTKRSPTKIYTSNDSGELVLVFFSKIPPFIFSRLKVGKKCTVAGKVQIFDGFCQINHPEFIFKKELLSPIEPIYHLTYGIINKQLYGYIIDAVAAIENSIKAKNSFGKTSKHQIALLNEESYMQELLSEIKTLHLINLEDSSQINKQIDRAIKLLSVKELFANQVALSRLKRAENKVIGQKFSINKDLQRKIIEHLGFQLTPAQESAILEIEQSQAKQHQMMRLLQGDVGSGKTLVALLTMVNVVSSGYQAALMVPTDLLSVQHFKFFEYASQALSGSDLAGKEIKCALLTGKTKAKERRAIDAGLQNGEVDILIGTHALFQESVQFKKLGYVVIDEQHRFGVKQRMELINKALNPDVLVMTATPIPRSLTLTIFGDMDVSLVKSKPKNRLPIMTSVISSSKRQQVIDSLKKKLDQGEKIYWVCPLIDKNDELLDKKALFNENQNSSALFANVTECFEELNDIYPEQAAILHGKMKSAEKDEIMQRFKNGDIRILVATTVIEVGIDVPDATLMIIENAERFGLSQLHQLRGRVGRGNLQSYCILIYNFKRLSEMARKRLEIMKNSNDGFYLAEQDLLLRGGGEILGTKQSGEPEFFFAELGRDAEKLIRVNKVAKETEGEAEREVKGESCNNSEQDNTRFIDFQVSLFKRNQEKLAKSG